MFYLAVGLMGLGILLVSFYILSGSAKKGAGARQPNPAEPENQGIHREAPLPVTPVAPNAPVARPPEPSVVPEEVLERPEPAPEKIKIRERETYKRVDSEALANVLKLKANQAQSETNSPDPLLLKGILYLNQNRNIPDLAELSGEAAARAFAELKRIGRGTLVLEGSHFLIRSGNASYNYSSADLEQILFQDRGIVLVPVQTDRPVPVFITDEPGLVKNYIKRNARILSIPAGY